MLRSARLRDGLTYHLPLTFVATGPECRYPITARSIAPS